jgi:hypothetical protein
LILSFQRRISSVDREEQNWRKMMMFELPDYEIIVWIVGNDFGKKLEKDILLNIGIMPYESIDYEGVLAIHFDFNTWDKTVNSADKIKGFIDNPNLIFLKAKNRNNEDASIIYKDERPMEKPLQNM